MHFTLQLDGHEEIMFRSGENGTWEMVICSGDDSSTVIEMPASTVRKIMAELSAWANS